MHPRGAGATALEGEVSNSARASLPATGFPGLEDVCLSLPTVVSREGAYKRLEVPLSDEEREGLLASAETWRQMQARFGV